MVFFVLILFYFFFFKSNFMRSYLILLSNSRLSLMTKSWLCFTPVARRTTRKTRIRRTPHQNLSEGRVLKSGNLSFWLSLRGLGGPYQKNNKNNKRNPAQIWNNGAYYTPILFYPHFFLHSYSFLYPNFLFGPKICFGPNIFQT